jgi:hypothetical protein
MTNSPASLVAAASAVATLGHCQGDISRLDDAALVQGLMLVRELDGQAQTYKLWISAEIARRSNHALGYDGLARKSGAATPAIFIQSLTGSSIDEATKLARMGQSIVDSELEGGLQTPTANAALSGSISVDAADAIRRGLGKPDLAVTSEQLSDMALDLIARAGSMTPEQLLKAARRARNDVDLDSIERGEKQRAILRYVRVWSRDGMSGGSWSIPDEDGGLEIVTALKLMIANKTNGPRFADLTRDTKLAADTHGDIDPRAVLEDEREPEQIMADGFVQVFHNGLGADPSVVPGAGRAPVRVIVQESVLNDRVANGAQALPSGSALLEESLAAITFGKLEEYLCEGGTIAITVDTDGNPLDVGREQRLFTKAQRTALGVRDCGCRFPGCEKPPSWTEAHHIEYWSRDSGPTNIANGMPWFAKRTYVVETEGVDDGKDEEAWRGWQFAGGVVCADQF